MILDTNPARKQLVLSSFQQEDQLSMQHFGRWDILDLVAVEVKNLAQPGIVDLRVAVRDESVEILALHLLLVEVYHSAEPTAHRIYH